MKGRERERGGEGVGNETGMEEREKDTDQKSL